METITDPLEESAASFTGILAGVLPEKLRSLAFASVISARSPDIYLMWHPIYRKKNLFAVMFYHACLLLFKKIKGLKWLCGERLRFRYKVYGQIEDHLLVSPALCGKEKDAVWQTSYVRTCPQDAVFVFGFGDKWGSDLTAAKPLGLIETLVMGMTLTMAGLRATLRSKGGFCDKVLVWLLWQSWVAGYEWLEAYYFKESLSDVLKTHSVQKVGCIHEMHGYARLIWILAKEHGLKTYVMQHASITDGKRWYFAHQLEREAGLVLPQHMYVYEPAMEELLRPFFPQTVFKYGLSQRYVHWKNARPLALPGEHVLFVSALAGFDNTVLINVLKHLCREGKIPRVHLRFHPLARLSRWQRQWIKNQVQRGWIVLTGDVPLQEDLSHAKVVIGMGTTVLEEALLLGRPVIHIQHLDYVQYIHLNGINGATLVKWDDIDARRIHIIAAGTATTDIRHRFGLGLPLVDYARFFNEVHDA